MMSLLLADLLGVLTNSLQIGGDSGWTGYTSVFPDDPDRIVSLFEVPGEEPGQDDVTPRYEFPAVQVRVRGQPFDAQQVISKIESVVTTLENEAPARFVYLYGREGGPAFLRFDRNDRPEYAWNMDGMSEIDA